MNFEELKNYEISKGFTSIGRIEDEFYNKINPESFKNIEEFNTFVANNSDYVKFVKDEDGELELVTINENNTNRYFMNRNGMYQVENTVYKILNDEVTISSQVENADKLVQLDLNNYKTNISSEFKVHTSKFATIDSEKGKNNLKSASPGCGKEAGKTQTNGKNRTQVLAYYSYESAGNGDYRYWLEANLRIKNQKKSLGIWINASRTTSYDLRVKYHYKEEGNPDWDFFSYDKTATQHDFSLREWTTVLTLTYTEDNHIEAYDFWCDTPSIDAIDIECNVAGL